MSLGDQLAEQEEGEEKHPTRYIIEWRWLTSYILLKGCTGALYSSTLPNGHTEVKQCLHGNGRKALQQNDQRGWNAQTRPSTHPQKQPTNQMNKKTECIPYDPIYDKLKTRKNEEK